MKCSACPLRDDDRPCLSRRDDYRWVCKTAEQGDPSFLMFLRTAGRPTPEGEEEQGGQSPPRPTVQQSLTLLPLIHACEYRTAPACGCTPAECSHYGKKVSVAECLRCPLLLPPKEN